jgi:hypothetical protein
MGVVLMFELQDVFSRFGNRFIDSNTVHYEGLKAIKAIMNCRTSSPLAAM